MGMALAAVGGEQKRCDLQWKFIVAAVGCHNGLLRDTWISLIEVGLGSKPKPLCLGINSSHWYWFSLFLFSNLQILLLLASFLCLIIDIHFSFLISINSDEAVSSTNRLKAFISIAFYGLSNRFGFLVLSLYSFVFQDDWIIFCLIIDFLTFVFCEFQLKNCCDRSGETNF